MSFFISVIILVLAMLIQVSMQLTPGTFALFYHYALGKNSRTKADNLSLYFTLGVITFMAIVWILLRQSRALPKLHSLAHGRYSPSRKYRQPILLLSQR